MTLDDLSVVCDCSCLAAVLCVCLLASLAVCCDRAWLHTLLSLTFSLHLDAVYTPIVIYTYMIQCIVVVLNFN